MTQTRNIAKTVFIILALVFASSAKAEGRVNFSFSVNVGGHNQHHGNDLNQIFNQVFQNGHHHRNQGHYQIGTNGMQVWVNDNHNKRKKVYKKKKSHKSAKLNSRKSLVRHLRRLGFRNVQRIHRNGRYYTARAISKKGHVVWVKVDRRNGRIKGQRVLAWNHRR